MSSKLHEKLTEFLYLNRQGHLRDALSLILACDPCPVNALRAFCQTYCPREAGAKAVAFAAVLTESFDYIDATNLQDHSKIQAPDLMLVPLLTSILYAHQCSIKLVKTATEVQALDLQLILTLCNLWNLLLLAKMGGFQNFIRHQMDNSLYDSEFLHRLEE